MRLTPAMLGLGLAHCWLFSMQRTLGPETSALYQPTMFFGMVAAFFACALASLMSRGNVSCSRPAAFAAVLAGMAATAVLIGVPGVDGTRLELALSFVVGIGVAWCYLLWGALYASMDVRQTALVLFASIALGSALKAGFHFVERGPLAAALLCLLPLGCLGCWSLSRRAALQGHVAEAPLSRRDAPFLGCYAVAVMLFGVAIGLARLTGEGFFRLTSAGSACGHFLEAAVSMAVVAAVYRQRSEVTFPRLWMLVLVVYATGIVLSEYAGGPAAGGLAMGVVTAAQMLVVSVWWFALADVAQRVRASVPSDAVFGLGYPVYMLPMALVSAGLPGRVGTLGDAPLLVVYALLVSVYLCMRVQPREGQALFVGLVLRASAEGDALERQLDRAQGAFGLTAREREVAGMYARGRSRAYIAGKLCLTEATVRDHISHVYKKMGVHNKQDFLSALEG